MKKLILLTTVLILTYGCVLAQSSGPQRDTSTIFEINPMGADVISPQLRLKKSFKFRVSNVNVFKVDAYGTAKSFNFETSVPEIFKNTPLPNADKNESAEKEAKKGGKAMRYIDVLNKQLEEQKLDSGFAENYNKFSSDYHTLQKMVCVEDTLYNSLPDVIIPDTALVKRNAKNYMKALYGSTKEDDYLDTLSALQKRINESYVTLKKAYEQLNKLPVKDTLTVAGQLKSTNNEISINVDNSKVVIKQKLKFDEEYKAATKIFNNINNGDNPTKLYNKAAKGISFYTALKSSKFTALIDGTQLKDDELEFTPILKDKNKKVLKEFNPVSITAFGGVKVNFTTGYLLSFIGDDNYTSGTVDLKQGVTKQGKSNLTNAIGALAHVYRRSASGVSVGGSVGFSLTSNGNVGFYLGGSGLFLEKNRLALTAGISFTKVNRLNTANLTYFKDDKYTFNSTEDVKPNYDSLYKPAFFFGITYNVFSGNETKASK